MQLARTIGHATATVKHATLAGLRMLLVQPLGTGGDDDGDPILAIDALGAGRGDIVMISCDGGSIQELVGAKNTPIRWAVIGLADQ